MTNVKLRNIKLALILSTNAPCGLPPEVLTTMEETTGAMDVCVCTEEQQDWHGYFPEWTLRCSSET